MKKSALFIFLALLVSFSSIAQSDKEKPVQNYLFSEFSHGTILLKSGKLNDAALNYHLLTQEMVYVKDGQHFAIDNIGLIDTVYIQGKRFVPHNEANFFYEVVPVSRVPLYVQHKSKLLPPRGTDGYGPTSPTSEQHRIMNLRVAGSLYELGHVYGSEIKNDTEFFIKWGRHYRKANSRGQLIDIFPERKKQIKEYVKGHKVDFRNQEDVMQLLLFLQGKSAESL